MARLVSDADPALWVPVTESFGLRGRRHRKAALRMLVAQATTALGTAPRGSGRFATWAMSQAVPALMRKANGRVLVWVYKADPELVVAMATIQQVTSQMRTARAMRPIEYDDTVAFRHKTLGVGEKLVMTAPQRGQAPFVSYTWDFGSTMIELVAVTGDPARFGTTFTQLDDLAHALRMVNDITASEGGAALTDGEQ